MHAYGDNYNFIIMDVLKSDVICCCLATFSLRLSTLKSVESYYNSSSVCLSVCSPTPPRSFDGSSKNLVGVCRWTSELPLRGSFLKRSTGQQVKHHFFGADDTRLRPHRCKRHTASFAEHGVFCPAKGTRRLRV